MALRTHFQPGATIVQVHGVIQADDAARLAEYFNEIADTARLFVIDVRGVDFFSDDGLLAVVEVVEQSAAGTRRALVAGEGIARLAGAIGDPVPVSASIRDVLLEFGSREDTSADHSSTDH